jgi:hypothetical protein
MRIPGFLNAAVRAALTFALCGCGFAAETHFILSTSPSNLNGVLNRHSLALVNVLRPGIYKVSSSPNVSVPQLKQEVSADPDVSTFEKDRVVRSSNTKPTSNIQASISALAGALNDVATVNYYGAKVRHAYSGQPAAGMIELAPALSQWGTGNVVVAVIDTGVDPGHPVLRDVLVSGYDFTRDVAGPASELADLTQSTVAILEQSTVAILEQANSPAILNQSTVAILEQSTVAILEAAQLPAAFGHGTMVAGLIHLVAPTARIMPLKVFNADGSSDLSDIISAIYYAVDHNAKVINMSFAMSSQSPELAAAISYAKAHGVICISAAGNDGKQVTVYPAAFNGVVGVGSITLTGKRSAFSNYGKGAAETSAPGEALITTYPGGYYAGVWGSSFSAALASGAAALMAGVSPNMGYAGAGITFGHGKRVEDLGMGQATLDVLSSLGYLYTDPDTDGDQDAAGSNDVDPDDGRSTGGDE